MQHNAVIGKISSPKRKAPEGWTFQREGFRLSCAGPQTGSGVEERGAEYFR
jgi:hypothetical protein